MSDILIVDDEADIRDLIADILQDEGHATREASDADGALGQVTRRAPALIILDIWLQGSRMDGIEVLKSVKRDNPEIPVVIISGHGNIEIAVAAIQQGAYDFIEKPFTANQLLVVVTRALEAHRLRRDIAALRARESADAVMIGASPAMAGLAAKLQRVARTQSRVMLSGPPGSGKEVAARRLHALSDRAQAPFVVVNAASIEPQRMEAVLFGQVHEDGRVEPGLFERAHRGLLFIDEVAEMPAATQAKILRVLTDQSFQRLGGGDVVRVDVRVISATNRDLEAEIAAGRFREDLFHRLAVVPIEVPGLDARREDIPALVEHFSGRLTQTEGLPRKPFTPEALAFLQTRGWPGNVRQLKNLVERLLIVCEGDEIGIEDVCGGGGDGEGEGGGGLNGVIATLPLREARELFEREYLIAQINRFGGNISRTAHFIGMERSALHRKLKSLGVTTATRGRARIACFEEDEL
ncbi:MAG: sigma-54-dependent transcriptional regulator [Rubrimonas sp.]|uniref:nitrogen assimilation response regulator NtrX n=1 Tax=Rubrimonas sp. TaxID=2036015 RepID=UPI002FDE3C46